MTDLIPGQRIIDAIDRLDSKFEEFRRDMQEWKQATGERVQALESVTKPALVNNGQKSRLAQAEDRIRVLENSYMKAIGASSVSGAVVALAFELVRKHFGL